MITIINTTKQNIQYLNGDKVTVIPAAKKEELPLIVRKREYREIDSMIGDENVKLNLAVTTKAENVRIPERKEGVLYIVNKIIFHAFPEREDFIMPTSTKMYNNKGKNSLVCTKFIKRELNK